jgi:hypothetical protein
MCVNVHVVCVHIKSTYFIYYMFVCVSIRALNYDMYFLNINLKLLRASKRIASTQESIQRYACEIHTCADDNSVPSI